MALTLFRAPAYDYRPRRRFAPLGVPFPYDPATEQYARIDVAGPYDANSFADVDSTVGNYIVFGKTWSPSGNPVLIDPATLIPYMDVAATGRQSVQYREWISATRSWLPVGGVAGNYSTYWINNVAPVEITPIPDQTGWTNIAIAAVIISAGVTDAEGDTLTYTGLSIPGLSIDPAYVVGPQTAVAIVGTPTVANSYVVNLTVTDITGASTNLTAFDWVIGTGVAVPISSGVDYPDYIDDLGSAGLTLDGGDIVLVDTATPVGEVDTTSPVAGTYLPPGSPVTVYVSAITGPDLVGDQQADAETELTSLGLLSDITTQASDEPVGTVLSAQVFDGSLQNLAGLLLLPGTTVYLVVAAQSGTETIDRIYFRVSANDVVLRVLN